MAHNQLNTLVSDIQNKHNKDWIKWKRIIDKSVVIRINRLLQRINQGRRGLRVTRVTPQNDHCPPIGGLVITK